MAKSENSTIEPPQAHSRKISLFTSYCYTPEGVHLENPKQNEKVILFLRQHIIFTAPWILGTIVMAIAPTIIFPVLFIFLKLPFTIPLGYITVGIAFWYIATFGFFLANFLLWSFNIFIVTNKRAIDIDFLYLLYKESSESELDKIQDISYVSKGILSTFFTFGNVLLQTASEIPNLEFERVPNPEKVTKIISDLVGGKR
jgi:hypothetical protein